MLHNKEVMSSAQHRAYEMRLWPSPLEVKMKMLLDTWGITYEDQKIFYIFGRKGWINKYYIADFYIPAKKIIIEVDGKFHDDHKQHDKMRTKEIQEQYPGVEVVRYKSKDLSNEELMMKLLYMIR